MILDFNHDYVLENERVLLRPLKWGDRQHLVPFSLNEPTIWKFSLQGAQGDENLDKYLQLALDGRAKQTEYPFIVFDKQTQRYAGSTRFYDIQLAYDTLQLGYTWYGKDFQRTGINRNCKYLLLQFAFEQLRAERVEFRADNLNERSIAAMKAIGCKVEGVLRSNMPTATGERRRDSIVLSILKDEWEKEVKELLWSMIK